MVTLISSRLLTKFPFVGAITNAQRTEWRIYELMLGYKWLTDQQWGKSSLLVSLIDLFQEMKATKRSF